MIFDTVGMVIYEDLGVTQTTGQCTIQLKATDPYGAFITTEFQFSVYSTTPYISNTNATCYTNWLSYKYLDNEVAGVY